MSQIKYSDTRDWSAYIAATVLFLILFWFGGLFLISFGYQRAPMLSVLTITPPIILVGYVLPMFSAFKDPKIREEKSKLKVKAGVIIGIATAVAVYALALTMPSKIYVASGSKPFVMVLTLCLVVTLLTALIFEAPRRPIRVGADHMGGLRANETHLRGASVRQAKDPLDETAPIIAETAMRFGTVQIDHSREPEHFFIAGASGTGKSQLISANLAAIRARGAAARAVILDPSGIYYSQFGRPGVDELINPFDERSAKWSPFAELKGPADYRRVAAAMVPSAEGAAKEWSEFGRKIIADTLRAMMRSGERDAQKLYRLLDGSAGILAEFLNAAGINSLTGEDNMKMFSNAKATIASYIEFLEYLPPGGDFSVRDWVSNRDGQDGWLFVTYNDNTMELLRQFVATIADLAILEGLSLQPDPDRRLFYVADELDSLGHVGQLKDGLVKLRKFGGCCILGIQTMHQLKVVYRENAGAIEGNCGTLAILRANDTETAEYFERRLGKVEIERTNLTQTRSTSSAKVGESNTSSSGHSVSKQVETRPVILASELQKLPNLSGVLARGAEHILFRHEWAKPVRKNPPLVERVFEAL